MAETTTKNYIIGVIMMMMFVVGGISLLSLFNDADSSFDSDGRAGEFNRTFNKLDDVSSQVHTIESSFDAEPQWGIFGALNSLIQSAWNTITLVITSWGFMDSVFIGMNAMFGVPLWVATFIGLIITIIIAFAIYSLIFQRGA